MTSLDVSGNPLLEKLWCHKNQLTSLDVRNGNNTAISSFIAHTNNLLCIDVDDPAWSTANWTSIDAGVFYSTNCALALPVELTNFGAHLKNNQTHLHWQTASETNNEGFEIQHSLDGIDWQRIGFEEGNGTSFEEFSYSFIHDQPKSGVNYYRLKQLDYDGAFEYSDIVSVHFSKEKKEIALFPNPSIGILNLSVNEYDGAGTLSIHDISGKEIYREEIQEATRVDLSNQPKGVYWAKWQMGREVIWEKIILQ